MLDWDHHLVVCWVQQLRNQHYGMEDEGNENKLFQASISFFETMEKRMEVNLEPHNPSIPEVSSLLAKQVFWQKVGSWGIDNRGCVTVGVENKALEFADAGKDAGNWWEPPQRAAIGPCWRIKPAAVSWIWWWETEQAEGNEMLGCESSVGGESCTDWGKDDVGHEIEFACRPRSVLQTDGMETAETKNGTGAGKIWCAAVVEDNGTVRSSIELML